MGTSKAVHMLVEVHHLKAIELIGDFLNLVLFTFLDELDTFGIPRTRLVILLTPLDN